MNAPAIIPVPKGRGNVPGDQTRKKGQRRAGTIHEGKQGNPAHIVTEANQAVVASHAAIGTPQETMAHVMGISVDTLKKYYGPQLEHGLAIANSEVAGKLFKNATADDSPHQQRAIEFWLATRARWRKTDAVEHTFGSGEVEGAMPAADVLPAKIIVEFVGRRALTPPDE